MPLGNNNIDEFDPSSLIDKEEDIVDINTEFIDNSSIEEATGLIENLKDIYADKKFMEENPKFMVRLKKEVEDLRILLKVRKSDETVHDILLGSIGKNPSNASLFRALTDVQKTILATTTDISNKVKDINGLLKGIQLEIDFNKPPTEEETKEGEETTKPNTFRGTKDFIKSMKEDE